MLPMEEPTYVRTAGGRWYVYTPSNEAKHGFFLVDHDQAFDGGLGLPRPWVPVLDEHVPTRIRARLGRWLEKARLEFVSLDSCKP